MKLYDCATGSWRRWRSPDTSSIMKRISSIRNYFNYQLLLTSRSGSRGYRGGIEA